MSRKSKSENRFVPAEVKAQLNTAKMATFKRIPFTKEAEAFVDALYEQVSKFELETDLRKRRRRSKDAQSFRVALGAMMGDLLISASHIASGGYFYRSQEKGALNATKVTYPSFRRLVDVLERLELLEKFNGYMVHDRFDDDDAAMALYGKAGRYRATNRLIQLASQFGIEVDEAVKHFIIDPKDRSNLVECRPADKRKIHIEQTGENLTLLTKAQDEIARINEIYANHTFGPIDQPRLRRIFNNADLPGFKMDQGGRLASMSADDWMNNKEVRSKVRIDGEGVVKIDISSCHLTIVYGLLGFDFDPTNDPYHIEGIPREVVKQYVTMRLGLGRRPLRWRQGAAKLFKENTGVDWTKKFKIKYLHGFVEQEMTVFLEAEEVGITSVNLQYEESEILISTILDLGERFNVAVLPIHDCLVVPKSKLELAKDRLGFHFFSRTKVHPRITLVG